MKTAGFSLIEILVALMLLSAFMLASFQALQHFNQLEQNVHEDYVALKLIED
jgi:prepilin-type N-terminal cleavage/methylation domain-containing protein